MKRLLPVLLLAALLSACGKGSEVTLADKASAEAKAYMEKNAKAEGIHALPSGVQYKIVRSGPANGLKPGPNDEVKVHYEGKLTSGFVFDSSYERGQPLSAPLPGLIPAWREVLPMMRPGDEWILYVPPEQGYGDMEAGQIPPNSVLIFRIELIGVLAAPGRIQQG